MFLLAKRDGEELLINLDRVQHIELSGGEAFIVFDTTFDREYEKNLLIDQSGPAVLAQLQKIVEIVDVRES